MPCWLDGFLSKSHFELFFTSVDAMSAGFDVLKLPGEMWADLYLLHVREDGSLPVAVAGGNLTAAFDRDLTGADLTTFLHGPASHRVVDAFQSCVTDRASICLRKQVHLQEKGITRIVEGAIAPFAERGEVRKVAGCLYFYELYDADVAHLSDLCRIRPAAPAKT